jgi:integrase
MQRMQNEELYYSNFVNALKTKATKREYQTRLKYFMDYIGAKSYTDLVENIDKKTVENHIKSYLVYLRQERGITFQSATHYLNPIKKFYYVNLDYEFKWSLIKMYLGNDDYEDNSIVQEGEEDRPYNRSEIQKMLKTANDIRSKIIILLISSSGMRSGALPLLKIRNLTKIEQKDYYLYQINVYEKSKRSNYKTFCTPECASLIDSYLNYRKHAGENLRPEAPLIREQFNPSDSFKVNNPKHIGLGLVKYLVNEVLTKYSTLKQKIEYDYERKKKKGKNSTMLTHALRKYFDTTCRKAGVYPDFIELLMGHRLPGIRHHYFKPEINDIFFGTRECKGYVSAINELTINDENRLKIENEELKTKLDKEFATFGQELTELKEMLSGK